MTDNEPSPSGLFIPGMGAEQAREIQRKLLLPVGTFVFELDGDTLYDQPGPVVILRVPTGSVLFQVVRDESRNLHFTHASPGTGTRTATLALPQRQAGGKVRIAFTWTAQDTTLYAGYEGNEPTAAVGAKSPTQMRVVNDAIFQIGDVGIEVMNYQVFESGHLIVRETAIETWESTLKAIDIHMQGSPTEGYLGEVVRANLALVMIATGFETYCGRRFRELPSEGRAVNVAKLAAALIPAGQRPPVIPDSIDEVLERKQVDFGNYDNSSRAFKSAYGIRFAHDLGVPPQVLADVRRMLEYRHRIVHVSPLTGLLNQPRVPPAEPVFSNAKLVQTLVGASDAFVRALHNATLGLPPKQT